MKETRSQLHTKKNKTKSSTSHESGASSCDIGDPTELLLRTIGVSDAEEGFDVFSSSKVDGHKHAPHVLDICCTPHRRL